MYKEYIKKLISNILILFIVLGTVNINMSFANDNNYIIPKAFESKTYENYLKDLGKEETLNFKVEASSKKIELDQEVVISCVIDNAPENKDKGVKVQVGNEIKELKDNNLNLDFKLKLGKAGNYKIPVLVFYDKKALFYELVEISVQKQPTLKENIKAMDSNTYTLGDYVWDDTNENGIQDADESGVEGVYVILTRNGDQRQTITDANGHYEFDNLENGEYHLRFEIETFPEDYEETKKNVGSDNTVDSDGNNIQVVIDGSDRSDVDLGITSKPFRIGDRVWDDSNNNGVQDPGESGIEGVKVKLYKEENGTSTLVDEKTTNNMGSYAFEVKEGVYNIKFDSSTFPEGYYETKSYQTEDRDKDSNSSRNNYINITDDYNMTIDLGLTNKVHKVGDYIWNDANHNGIQDADESGIEGVKVYFNYETIGVDKTYPREGISDANGHYEILLPDGDYKADLVYPDNLFDYYPTVANAGDNDSVDSDWITNGTPITVGNSYNSTLDFGLYKPESDKLTSFVWDDSNGNGIQDAGEEGIEGVIATIYYSGNQYGIKSATSDANGEIVFDDLLETETYSIKYDFDTFPEGYYLTKTDAGDDDTKDSDGLDVYGINTNGEDVTHVDLGLTTVEYKLGDYVFDDINGNAIKDDGEVGIQGVKAYLFYGRGDGSEFVEVGEAISDQNGHYQFDHLHNGAYKVIFDTSTIPEGYMLTGIKAGGNPGASQDGFSVNHLSMNGEDILNVDLGLSDDIFKVGDYVWYDSNGNGIQDVGEEGIESLEVFAYNEENAVIASTRTSEDGTYELAIPNGKYYIYVDYEEGETIPYAGDDETIDSNGNYVGVIVDNADDMTIDIGYTDKRFIRTTDSVEMLDAPNGNLISVLDRNTIKEFVEYSQNWAKVINNGSEAYISKYCVTDNLYADSNYVVRTTSGVNVRDEVNGNLIGRIEKNTLKTVYGYRRDSGWNKWLKVWYNDRYGYIYGNYTSTELKYNVRINTQANVRKSPWGEIIGTINKDVIKTVYGQTYDNNGEMWLKIWYNGQYAYIHSSVASNDLRYYVRTMSNVNVRKSPGGTKVGTIDKNIIKTVYGQSYNNGELWLKVWYNGQMAYIHSGSTSSNLKYIARTVSSLNVRKSPGGAIVGKINKNTLKTIYSQTYKNGYMWLKVWYKGGYNYVYHSGVSNDTIYNVKTKIDVNVRATPGGLKVGTIPKGTVKTVYGQNYKNGSMWLKIWYNNSYKYIYSGNTTYDY